MANLPLQGLFNSLDGTSIYYEVQGEGRPLLFCYGLLCRKEHWHHQIEHLKSKYQIITFDYRGHHSSARPANDRHLTLQWCATDLHELLNHLGLEEVVVLGHSMGVPVLSCFLPQEKERVRGSVFVCGSVTNPFQHMFHSNRMMGVYQLTSFIYDQAPNLMGLLWQKFTEKNRLGFFMTSRLGFNASRAQAQDVLMYMEGVNQTPYSVFHSLISDYMHFDGMKYLPQIECPTLVIAGEADHITPLPLQEAMVSALPKGKLYRVAEGSHNAHMDFPADVNVAIDRFLKEIGYT